jgi:chromosome segregation ATPase
MLLGEPSPSLARINRMPMMKLGPKIEQLQTELDRVEAKLERMKGQDEPPTERIAAATDLIKRLKVLKELAEKRLEEKTARKAAWDARQARDNG